jgi:uncharacterized protein Smg (DUF494 family)
MSKELPSLIQDLLKTFLEEISKDPAIKAMLEEIRTKLIEFKDGRVTSLYDFEETFPELQTEFEFLEQDEFEEPDAYYFAKEFSKNTTRIYSVDEQNSLGAEKIGNLMMLEHMGIIDAVIREKIIYALIDLNEPYCDIHDFYLIVAEAIRDSATPEQALLLTKMLEDYSLSVQH